MSKHICTNCSLIYGEGPQTNPKKMERGFCSKCWDWYLETTNLNIRRVMNKHGQEEAKPVVVKAAPTEKKYSYVDHAVKVYMGNGMFGKTVFVCKAANILEADEMYKSATGNDPIKQAYVGVSWE